MNTTSKLFDIDSWISIHRVIVNYTVLTKRSRKARSCFTYSLISESCIKHLLFKAIC